MEKPTLDDKRLLTILKQNYNDREVAMYFLKKAKVASAHAINGINSSNYLMVTSNLAEVNLQIEMLYQLLNKDEALANDK